MENSHDIKGLFTKYLNKSISRNEYDALLKYFGKQNDNELGDLITRALSEDIAVNDDTELNEIVDSVEYKLRQKLQPRKKLHLKQYIPYAAIIIAALLGGSYLLLNYHTPKQKVELITDVKPGHSAAMLTLANGKKILLNEVSNGSIANEGGISVSKNKNGEVVYTVTGSNDNLDKNLNTLSTTNGETYQIVLSDGTRVWLNAATTLQYSTNLKEGDKRKVKLLTGEAYFEVAKDKQHPFIVETAKQEVEVLGTHFNINSYVDEGRTVTTLEEGSVKVSPIFNGTHKNNIILKPGQQSLIANGNINVRQADIETALAWKNGEIYFKDATIQEVLRQVSRWYNVEIKYKGIPTRTVFNGGIKRDSNLSTVLRILKLSNVQFELKKENNTTTLIVQ
ncbi:FecR domain-containing protein [Pedobacter sp. ISL-68]|uniref:FecR family protein n=1 Tax=unclassified Pedobacter TaxID=2628915 RepID=UPI001BEBF031|nr:MULTISPECIES: FecR family protein [unclassified Pedobacter]MBT2559846.1 FecR domain-containing protein [Pedobacter sp. ISL-64]MBT2592151.1 FecR domain-containing protein [Pedobacter sp. ISL-68]